MLQVEGEKRKRLYLVELLAQFRDLDGTFCDIKKSKHFCGKSNKYFWFDQNKKKNNNFWFKCHHLCMKSSKLSKAIPEKKQVKQIPKSCSDQSKCH